MDTEAIVENILYRRVAVYKYREACEVAVSGLDYFQAILYKGIHLMQISFAYRI